MGGRSPNWLACSHVYFVMQVNTRLSLILYENGVQLFNMRQFEQAQHAFSQAIELNPKVALYFTYRGQCRYVLGDFDEASAVRLFRREVMVEVNIHHLFHRISASP